MQKSPNFFDEVFGTGKQLVRAVTFNDYFSIIKTSAPNAVHGLIFLAECIAPFIIYNFPLVSTALVVSLIIGFVTAIFKTDFVDDITNFGDLILNRRPITLWIICYNLEIILGLLVQTIEANLYAVAFVVQLFIVDICHYV